jgi:plastocyanin
MTQPRFRSLPTVVMAVASVLGFTGVASAAAVKGTVSLPAELKTGRRFLGHWRVENTNVAVQHGGTRAGTIVLLVGPQYQAVPPKSASVEISGLQATPTALVVSEGTVVEFKNSDKVSHELAVPERSDVMAPERLASGSLRKQRFAIPGEYVVRCTEYPHIAISILVTSSPLFSITDDKGAFKIADVPPGHATLKIWSNGRWVHEQEIDIPERGLDLSVKVKNATPADAE